MILILELVILALALWAAAALYVQFRSGVGFHHAALYAPLKLLFRISDREARQARSADAPVVYAIWHGGRLDTAVMLSLLPEDTLHILDQKSARTAWLEPWRALARCIEFNAKHVFVSRRLVQRLKGRGRMAVYLPDDTNPDTKAFRLFRAVARIALKAEASVVPVYIKPGGVFPGRKVLVLPPHTIAELMERSGDENKRASQALFDRMMEVRGDSQN